MKYLAIVQARSNSTRLPKKVLLKVNGKSLLAYEIERIRLAKKVDKIVVATTVNSEDDDVEALCKEISVDCFRGSENDVLDRYYQCSLLYPEYDGILRLTGDCPLIDPDVIDEVIAFFERGNYDFVNNAEDKKETYPDGLDTEIFSKKALHDAAQNATAVSDREHVVLYMIANEQNKIGYVQAPYDFSHIRMTVDNEEDFSVVKFLIENSKITDRYMKYISILTKYPNIMMKNMHIKRNEGLEKSLVEDNRDGFGKVRNQVEG